MPRGQKTCDKCGTVNGPRAYFCKKCEQAFVINGKKATPLMKPASDTNDYLEHFTKINYKNDPSNVKYYDNKAECWISQCGQFRIRRYDTFMGIDVGHRRRIMLEKRVDETHRCGPDWDIISRHVAIKSAARRYVRLKRQMKPKLTAKEKREQTFRHSVASKTKRRKK